MSGHADLTTRPPQSPSLTAELKRVQHESGGWLPESALRRLAERLGEPLYKLQAVASFFTHFRFEPPPPATVAVCRDFACHLAGAPEFTRKLERLTGKDDGVEVVGKSCMGRCDGAVAVMVNHECFVNRTPEQTAALARRAASGEHVTPPTQDRTVPAYWNIDPYDGKAEYKLVRHILEVMGRHPRVEREKRAAERLEAVEKKVAFSKKQVAELPEDDPQRVEAERWLRDERLHKTLSKLEPEVAEVYNAIFEGALVGKGGPGAGTAKKWGVVIDQAGPTKYVVCNADESEPGTFKDRELMLRVPHLVLEGMLAAGLVVGAERVWIYVRHEYPEQIMAMREAIEAAREAGVCGRNLLGSDVSVEADVFESPGNYICGEQTAMIEAMEDRRAEPRQRPPNLEIRGLLQKPTLVNNVETFAWVPSIALHGGAWYKKLGTDPSPKARTRTGMRFVSVSGHVTAPGVYEVPLGCTVGELLEWVGGMDRGRELAAFAVSGPSGGLLPRFIPRTEFPEAFREKYIPDGGDFDLLNLPLDNNFFRYELGGCLGTLGAAHMFVAEGADLRDLVANFGRFFRNESCGKCVPCRMGTRKLVQMADDLAAGGGLDDELLGDLHNAMSEASICGLGQVASNPLFSLSRFFPKLIDAPVRKADVRVGEDGDGRDYDALPPGMGA